ncbi:MAG TPA: class I SAM-dependent methyltransferase [Bryobacteraceae bacterium]|nr:class I SAM-dependent methyltransferase [Bryobacteraceae bacterium]
MSQLPLLPILPALLCALALPGLQAFQPRPTQPQKLAPYVSSPQPLVAKMLELSGLKQGETVFDLGSGDGRILIAAARDFGARAVGVELSGVLARRSREQAELLGLGNRIEVIEGDLLTVDLKDADVVSLYLMTEANAQLRPKLERELKPGTRVVSLEFEIRGWKPVKVEKFTAHRHDYKIYLYEIPAK